MKKSDTAPRVVNPYNVHTVQWCVWERLVREGWEPDREALETVFDEMDRVLPYNCRITTVNASMTPRRS